MTLLDGMASVSRQMIVDDVDDDDQWRMLVAWWLRQYELKFYRGKVHLNDVST